MLVMVMTPRIDMAPQYEYTSISTNPPQYEDLTNSGTRALVTDTISPFKDTFVSSSTGVITDTTPEVTDTGVPTSTRVTIPDVTTTDAEDLAPFTTLVLDWAMHLGKWGNEEFCPYGTFAYAFRIKVESEKVADDTSMNGIELYCRNPREHSQLKESAKEFRITSAVGKWGQWRGWKECKDGLLTGLRMKSEMSQGDGDDTAANDLEMQCNNSNVILNGGGNRWGHYSSWAKCPMGSAICGLVTQVEPDIIGDDTALNDVQMFCCHLPL